MSALTSSLESGLYSRSQGRSLGSTETFKEEQQQPLPPTLPHAHIHHMPPPMMEDGNPLHKVVSMHLTLEQYDRLFFQPTQSKGDLAERLANPTLLGLVGFLVPFTLTTFCLCGFQNGGIRIMVAVSGSFYFFGGIALIIAGICEFILGNTFPFSVFTIFGCHLLTGAYTGDPSHMMSSIYDGGTAGHDWNIGAGFYNVCMAIVSAVFLFGTIRVNVPFVAMFAAQIFFFAFIAAGQFELANNPTPNGADYARKMFKAAGSFGFIVLSLGWYLAIISACASTGVPCPLPVYDLSSKVFPNNLEAQMYEHAGHVRSRLPSAATAA